MFVNDLFCREYKHSPYIVNVIIRAIKRGEYSEDAASRMRHLIFRMMKVVIMKNCNNYLRLMKNTIRKELTPEMSELITDCFDVMYTCINNYNACGDFDFYFYFNKALSRYFFKRYQNCLATQEKAVEIGDVMMAVDRKFIDSQRTDMELEMLLSQIDIKGFDREVVMLKISGEKIDDFLARHPDKTKADFSRSMSKIKAILSNLRNRGEL
nr:MAG TPA: hypothetical protein [Caudoviricetes sp.]